MRNKKVILSSILSLIFCASLIVGATFSLATSNSEVNIAIQSGNVSVNATITNLKTYSAQPNAESTGYIEVEQPEGTFVNGGTAKIENDTLTLDRMIHGDKATFDIVLENNSNIDVQYQTIIQTVEDTGLFEGLEVTIAEQSFNGYTAVSDWKSLPENALIENSTWSCSVSLPIDAASDYQDKFTKIAVSVNAVQGNAIVSNPDSDAVNIYTVSDLRAFANSVNNGNTYAGKQVLLHNDINLGNEDWTPIGYAALKDKGNGKFDWDWDNSPYFAGTLDGQGHTISNLYINSPETNVQGFFGYGKITEVKNLTFNNAFVAGLRRAAVLVGQNDAEMTVSNVKFTGDIKVEATKSEAGTLAGRGGLGIVSNVTVNVEEDSYVKCLVENNSAWEYVGGVWGHAWPTAENITSNIDVYSYSSSTGGIGGGSAISSNNIVCSGNVTIAIKDTEIHKNSIQCWQTNGTIYGFGVGSSNTASHTNCTSTGTLSISGEVITDNALNGLAIGYLSNDVRFGAPYYADGVLVIDGKASTSSAENLDTLLKNDAVNSVTVTGGNFDKTITVPEGKEFVADNVTLDTSANYSIAVDAEKDSTVIINSGSYKAFDYAQVINAQAEGANVEVNGGTFDGNYLAYVAETAKVTVNNCTFATEDNPATVLVASDAGENALLTINDGTFYSDAICNQSINVAIKGGMFYLNAITNDNNVKNYITITGGTFNIDPTNYLAEGYSATQNDDGMWVVSAN